MLGDRCDVIVDLLSYASEYHLFFGCPPLEDKQCRSVLFLCSEAFFKERECTLCELPIHCRRCLDV